MPASKLHLYGLLTVASTLATLANAYSHTQQFYTACIYLRRSDLSTAIICNAIICSIFLIGKAIQKSLLGNLFASEVEHVTERSYFFAIDIVFTMTIFRDDFNMSFAVLFFLLLGVKIFHWLYQDRVDLMPEQQELMSWRQFGTRKLAILAVILTTIDYFLLKNAVQALSVMSRTNMMLLFAYEYAILLSMVLATTIKSVFHLYDTRCENGWEGKSLYIIYVDLAADFFKLVVYTIMFRLIIRDHGFPIHLIRDWWVTASHFFSRVRNLQRYLVIMKRINEQLPEPTAEELAAVDRVCVVCREEMEDRTRRLPCGHIFHFHCLKHWLEKQLNCPTCRRPLPTANEVTAPAPAPAAGRLQGQAQGQNPAQRQEESQQPQQPQQQYPYPGQARAQNQLFQQQGLPSHQLGQQPQPDLFLTAPVVPGWQLAPMMFLWPPPPAPPGPIGTLPSQTSTVPLETRAPNDPSLQPPVPHNRFGSANTTFSFPSPSASTTMVDPSLALASISERLAQLSADVLHLQHTFLPASGVSMNRPSDADVKPSSEEGS